MSQKHGGGCEQHKHLRDFDQDKVTGLVTKSFEVGRGTNQVAGKFRLLDFR